MRISYPALPLSPTGEWLAVGWAFVIDLRYASGSNDWLFFNCGMNFGNSIVINGVRDTYNCQIRIYNNYCELYMPYDYFGSNDQYVTMQGSHLIVSSNPIFPE